MSHVPVKTLSGFRSPLLLSPVRGDVLLALSGGADSIALLHCLMLDAKAKGYRLACAHVHHGIRAEEADADERFCKEICERLGVEYFCLRANVPALAHERGQNLEDCARCVRYEYFEELMSKEGFAILATAHHANDQLETLLLHATRGASTDGLVGIRPSRPVCHGHLVRPLLGATRAEILAFCKENGLSFVTDSTNADISLARNRLRAEVVPVLEKINPRVALAATRLCDDLSRDADFLSGLADTFLREHQTNEGIALSALADAHPSISTRAIARAFLAASGGVALSHHQVEAILSVVTSADPNASYDLPQGLCATKAEGHLRFVAQKKNGVESTPYEQPLHKGFNVISHTGVEIFIGRSQSGKNVYKNSTRTYLDPAIIKGTLSVRSRRAGDVILQGGMHKDVRKLISAHRVPLDMRDTLPIICDEDGILLIPTVALRDGAKAKSDDALVIEIKL